MLRSRVLRMSRHGMKFRVRRFQPRFWIRVFLFQMFQADV